MPSSQPSKICVDKTEGCDIGSISKSLFGLCVCFKAELFVGDQSGVIHVWDLKTDHNEQLIPEPEVSVNSVHIDPDASYMAAVNSSVSIHILLLCFCSNVHCGH